MEITFTVGHTEKTTVKYTRGWFLGKVRIQADKKVVFTNSIANPATHFSLTLTRCCKFSVGDKEIKNLEIHTIRPLLFAGFRPHTYKVFWNDDLITEKTGY